jgi:hypothetical protein
MPIYFIEDAEKGYIKIGYAKDASQRVAQLQTANPSKLKLLAVIEGGKRREKLLHQEFADAHKQGEWYNPVDALLRFIEKNREPQGTKPGHFVVGKFFHSWRKVAGKKELCWQGRVLDGYGDWVLVELYEWWQGGRTGERMVSIKDFQHWTFYQDDVEMRWASHLHQGLNPEEEEETRKRLRGFYESSQV